MGIDGWGSVCRTMTEKRVVGVGLIGLIEFVPGILTAGTYIKHRSIIHRSADAFIPSTPLIINGHIYIW
jgi:hypothetical protein